MGEWANGRMANGEWRMANGRMGEWRMGGFPCFLVSALWRGNDYRDALRRTLDTTGDRGAQSVPVCVPTHSE
ncbi:MAG TPA: hypothetical protein G4N96_10230 [Chloroflexi bacterium]|nr:hypothetical protein [Chloroflexota bacterium]